MCHTGKFTEDILCAHESELDRMRGFYKDNSDVFEQVENRELLWDSYIEFEVCLSVLLLSH